MSSLNSVKLFYGDISNQPPTTIVLDPTDLKTNHVTIVIGLSGQTKEHQIF